MFCPHCGSNTVDAHGVCQACGKETFDSSTDLEIHAISVGTGGNCPKCGAPLDQDEMFCGQCGAQISGEQSAASLVDSQATRAVIPRKSRSRLSSTGIAPRDYWEDIPPEEVEAPTEAYRRTTPRSTLRTPPSGGLPGRVPTYRPGSTARLAADSLYETPAPRSQTALIVGMLCFLASFITGGAAIWLAVTSLH
ncbi:MAG TPA: zinc-ribbon domain-containing protein [Ktedonobacterales bacterium]|nr:zinc-ribbon domain-containing protein [Ktedonobacterales bacterium]